MQCEFTSVLRIVTGVAAFVLLKLPLHGTASGVLRAGESDPFTEKPQDASFATSEFTNAVITEQSEFDQDIDSKFQQQVSELLTLWTLWDGPLLIRKQGGNRHHAGLHTGRRNRCVLERASSDADGTSCRALLEQWMPA